MSFFALVPLFPNHAQVYCWQHAGKFFVKRRSLRRKKRSLCEEEEEEEEEEKEEETYTFEQFSEGNPLTENVGTKAKLD